MKAVSYSVSSKKKCTPLRIMEKEVSPLDLCTGVDFLGIAMNVSYL